MKYLFSLFAFLLITQCCIAQNVTGRVVDEKNAALAFSSIYLKGSTKGTTANAEGAYYLDLPAGTYTLVCAHVGYQKMEQKIVVTGTAQQIDFKLREQLTELKDVVIKANAEDPAYAIIRNAIKSRKQHLNEVKQWQVMVYMKGMIKTSQVPKKIMGYKVDPNRDYIDSTGKGILYFSESLTRYSRRLPDDYKEEIISAKVSGSSQGFGFNSPRDQEVNLYENNVMLEGLNSRGFVSPISENALYFYNYKFDGVFYEDGQEINKIRVTARRKYEPCFVSGYINILEGSWRIHSVNLQLTKESQMEFVDSLRLIQQMFPVDKQYWMPQQTNLDASFAFFGIKAAASFSAVYSEYDLHKKLDKLLKGNVVRSIDTAANKKSVAYWDSIRPAPLTFEERYDYLRKDTLEKKWHDPHYVDSIDKRSNKFGLGKLLFTGTNITRRKYKMRYSFPAAIQVVQYNTVEGWVADFSPTIQHWGDTASFIIKPHLRYSFGNKHVNASLGITKVLGKDYRNRWNVTVSGGRYVYQISPQNPIDPLVNTISTLLYTKNYMKIYEKSFGQVIARHDFNNGLQINLNASFEDRFPMENIDTTYTWWRYKKRKFTNNYPEEIELGNFERHQVLLTKMQLTWQPGQKFVEYPKRRYSLGSKYPVFTLQLTKAWNKVFGSDAEFGKWMFSVNDDFNMKLGGTVRYNVSAGGYINNNTVQLPDWQHFMGNLTLVATPYVRSFQLAPYYANSTKDHFFSTANLEWHLNGLITNKIPLVRKWNLGIVTGSNAFYVDKNRNYFEFFAGIENILKVMRIDFVWGYDGFANKPTSGIKIGLSGILTGEGIE